MKVIIQIYENLNFFFTDNQESTVAVENIIITYLPIIIYHFGNCFERLKVKVNTPFCIRGNTLLIPLTPFDGATYPSAFV